MLDQPKPHQIFVHVIEGRGIDAIEKKGLSDVQCKITIGPTLRLRKQTCTKFQTANSVWNEKFVFENVMLTDSQWETEKIALTVVDRNDFTPNAMVGTVEFSLTNIYRQTNHEYYRKWTPIVRPDEPGKDHGCMQVSVYVLKRGDATPVHGDTEYELMADKDPVLRAPVDLKGSMYVLNVLLYRAEGLLPTHKKALNPFVSVRFNGATMQTKRMANIRNPIWNRKIVMPFQLPLHSDSIEIQIWNDNSMTPDTLIGQRTFSFHGERLRNRPFGPAWINLYSSHYVPPKTTFLGRLIDIMDTAQYIGEDEFVGRLLARISVRRVNAALNPRLRCVPCAPAVEPKGVEYVLDFYVYRGSEIPVQGGKVFIEIVFGSNRKDTVELIAANAGEYQWNQVFQNITAFGPQDLDEVHDVIINVYHKVGFVSRKIAFERIPVSKLVKDKAKVSYCIDGKPFKGLQMQPPRWRSLTNITYDEKNPHIIAGFLLCNIGFGRKHQRPSTLPEKIQKSVVKRYVLRVYVLQAVNLPAASDDGSILPFMVVRFAGRHKLIDGPKLGTKYPYFFKMIEIEENLDPDQVPSVNLMVYHKTSTGGQNLVGRCEILSGDILPPKELAKAKFARTQQPVITKYPLQVVNVLGKRSSSSSNKGTDPTLTPCIVAQVQLVEKRILPKLISGWKKTPDGAEFPEPFRLSMPKEIDSTPCMVSPYMLNVKCVGVRGLKGTGYENMARPNLRFSLPPDFVKQKSPIECKFDNLKVDGGGHADIMLTHLFQNLPIPKYSLATTPLVIGLYDGDTLVASCYVPLSHFAGNRKTWDAPTYNPKYDKRTGRPRKYKSVAAAMEEARADEIYHLRQKKAAEMAAEEEEGEDDEDGKNVQGSNSKKKKRHRIEQTLNLEEDDCNSFVRVEAGDGKLKEFDEGEIKDDDNLPVVANEMEEKPSFLENEDPFHHIFHLYRGKEVGISSSKVKESMLRGDSKHQTCQDLICKVKAYVQIVPESEGKQGARSRMALISHDHLAPYRELSQEYITRIYVYRAFNLSPRMHLGNLTCNPYLKISNGQDDLNQFSNEKNAAENDLNPLFFQVIELTTEFPANGSLDIEVWDSDTLGQDVMVGSTTVDIEQRVINKMARGEKEYRRLLNSTMSTSQGLILVKIDVLTAEQARQIKADTLSPPQFLDYQLRLILWSTYAVKFPQLENRGLDVDQKLIVTANFDGEKGQDIVKNTDVAWYAAEGCADWNWRMIFNLKLPCKNPRLRIAVWDENLLDRNEALGEVILNLSPFFKKCLLEKTPKTKDQRRLVSFEHSRYRSVGIGTLKLEMQMLTKAYAEENPAGEAQNEPNVDPFLPNPKRNSPPWAVGSRALDWLANRRALVICIAATVIVGALFIPVLYVAFASQ
mmetsp:Transcript_24644/g.34257  ORF Transcript_24644/g.34257 Transcript_24644/m.34257 type:complete len:1388 (+) Transcript_24644:81-4244(+)